MMQIAAYGKLGGDPKSIETNSRKAMAVASLAVNLEERGVEDPEPEWIGGGREQGTGAQAHGDDSGGRAAEPVTGGEDFDDNLP